MAAAPSMTSILKKSSAAADYDEDVQQTKEKRKTFFRISSSEHISSSRKLQRDLKSSINNTDEDHKLTKKTNEFRNDRARASLTDLRKTSRREKVSGKEKSASAKKSSDEAFKKDDDRKASKKATKKEIKLMSVKTTLKRAATLFEKDQGTAKKGTSKKKVAHRARLSSILHGLNVLDARANEKPKKEIAAKKAAENVATAIAKQRLMSRNTLQIPNVDSSKRFSVFSYRNKADSECELSDDEDDEDNTTEPVLAFVPPKYEPKDEFIVPSRGPSYSGYELPLHVKSKIRYSESCKRYQKQFQDEIHNLIAFQPTAKDAAFFARQMAYTTLGPPVHTKNEVDRTSKLFSPLTKKEQKRLRYLMANDIPFWAN